MDFAPSSHHAADNLDIWVHGQVVRPYVPPELSEPLDDVATMLRVYGRNQGWGIQFGKLNDISERWFQVPFPSLRSSEETLRLDAVTLLFCSQGGCGITQVDFYDGPNKQDFSLRMDEPLSGHHQVNAFGPNRLRPRRSDEMLPVSYALNISLRVVFGEPSGWIEFCAAHARFEKVKEVRSHAESAGARGGAYAATSGGR